MMSYREFTKTYNWVLKNFPATSNLYTDKEEKEIRLVKIEYVKSGSRWQEVKRTESMIDFIHYVNILDAIPFFKRLGGHERTVKGYTRKGYLPIEQHSISPDREQKSVYEFHF